MVYTSALRETETETETDQFSTNRKSTNVGFQTDRFSVSPVLVGVFFAPFFVLFLISVLSFFVIKRERERERVLQTYKV
jgi:hypothetical protein